MAKPWNSLSQTLLASALAGLWTSPLWAADESVYFSDLPVVASVSRLPQRLADAPTAVTVIDREIIKASGVRNLSDIFRLVPGFQTFANTTEAARVSYHGLNDEDYSPRVQVLIDGRSLYSPLFANGVNWATIPVALEDIERIEVVRGTNAVSYGSNAFLGVINIITVDPALARGFSVSTSYGNQNVRDYTLRAGGRIGDVGDFRFTYKQQNDDALTNRHDWIDSYRSRLFDFRSDFVLDETNSLQFSIGQVEGVTQQGRSTAGTFLGQSTNPFRDLRQTDSYAQLAWRRVLSPTSDFQLRYSYVVDKSSDAFQIVAPSQTYNINQSGDEGVRHELELQHTLQVMASSRLAWGASWRSDSMRSDWVLPGQGSVHREVGRLFGNFEWKPAHWFTGNAGLSGENDSLAGFHLSPRVSGNFHLTPENTVRIGYSRAFRTASTFDYRADYWSSLTKYQFSADPGTPSEKMDTWELGYLGDWRDWRASLDVRLFSEKIRDRLFTIDMNYAVNAIPATTIPIQNVHIKGLEYQFKWQPFEGSRLVLNQAFSRIDSEYIASALAIPNTTLTHPGNQGLDQKIDELSERSTPRRSTTLLLMQKLPFGLDFSVAGYWQDKMKWSVNTWSDKYRRIDARLGYPFRFGALAGELAFTVQSLNGGHGEYKAYGDVADRIVEKRQWLSLRLDY